MNLPFNQIVCSGNSKTGKPLTIRFPQLDDAQDMLNYINTLSNERSFIRFQGEQLSLEQEQAYLDKLLKEIENHKNVTLLAYSNDQLIGIAGIEMRSNIESHVGVFGISIAKDYRGEGIGSLLMKAVINQATQFIPDLKIITLEVFSTNPQAINLYKKIGFTEYGQLPNGIQHRGELVNAILMYQAVETTHS